MPQMTIQTAGPQTPLLVHCRHPLIQQALTELRNRETASPRFRQLIRMLARFLTYEAVADLPGLEVSVETPLETARGLSLQQHHIILAPILRAGLSMIDGAVEIFPEAEIRHVGLYRDEATLQPVEYYVKIPDTLPENSYVLILDPMLATGGSAVAAVDVFKRRGVKQIKFLSLIAAPEGIANLHAHHPDVAVYAAAVDSHLNEKGYIVPGLGDAGDRSFGT